MDYRKFVHEMLFVHQMARKALAHTPDHHPEAREAIMSIKQRVEGLEIFPSDILDKPYNSPCEGGITIEEG